MLRPAKPHAPPTAPWRSLLRLSGLSKSPASFKTGICRWVQVGAAADGPGSVLATALMTAAPAERVAILPSLPSAGVNAGRSRSHLGQLAAWLRRTRRRGREKPPHTRRSAAASPLELCAPPVAWRNSRSDSSGTTTESVVGQPRLRLVAATSSGPSGLPWACRCRLFSGCRSRASSAR